MWYSAPLGLPFEPQPVEVRRNDRVVETVRPTYRALPRLAGFARQMGVATVQLAEPQPGIEFDIRIPELDGRDSVRWKTLPAAVPEEGLSLVLSSCFWAYDDKEGHYHQAIAAVLRDQPHPAFRLLVGDQLYLDWPLWDNDDDSFEARVGYRYQRYWGDEAYRRNLLQLPNFFMCDDHEFWNNYPEWQGQLPFLWGPGARDEFGPIAQDYYHAFQQCLNPCDAARPWLQFSVPPASFFIADTRSQRTRHGVPGGPSFLSKAQRDALSAWQFELTGPGFLVLGQPLLQADGGRTDYSLSNFESDYALLLGLMERSLRGENRQTKPHDILILSGDIHTGRHCVAVPANLGGRMVHEFIASPASRIGPFNSSPKPERPPARVPSPSRQSGPNRPFNWSVFPVEQERPEFPTVENNLGVVRMFPAERRPYALRVELCSYLVRPHRPPIWQFWEKPAALDMKDHARLKLYESHDVYLS